MAKSNDLLIVAGVAGIVGAFWLMNRNQQPVSQGITGERANWLTGSPDAVYGGGTVSEIMNTALPGQPGWGWTYYTDGTAIGPDGTYYFNGQKVWNPA